MRSEDKKTTMPTKSAFNRLDDFLYQGVIKNLLFTSRLGRKSVHGLADSGINFDHIYQNIPKGYTRFGSLVDRILLNLPACKATRNRFDHVVNLIKSEIQNNRNAGAKTRIVDVASGPARYIVEALDDNSEDIECLCLDADHRSLNFGKSLAIGKPILFRRANALFLGKHLERLCIRKNWKPNLIVASGFYEYQTDRTVRSHFSRIFDFLENGGLFYAILQYKNPNRKLIEKVGKQKNGSGWMLHYRSPKTITEWLSSAGFKDISVQVDGWGHYVFGSGRKST